MARTVEEAPITTSASRGKMAARPKPYYRTIEPDLHLGFRKGKTGGRWVVRFYRGDGKYQVETFAKAVISDAAAFKSLDLDKVDERTPLDFRQAQRVAKKIHEARLTEAVHGRHGPITVRQIIEEYIDWLRANKKSATTAERFAKVHIYPRLGDVEAAKLTVEQLRAWHRSVAESPRRKRSAPGAPPAFCAPAKTPDEIRARKATANRVRVVLVAALNMAYLDGRLPSDLAWKRAKPFGKTEKSRDRYFTRDECRRLINACDPDMRDLVRGALYTGARYGDLCRMNVADFNRDSATVLFHTPKSGDAYFVHLNSEAVDWFAGLTVGRAAPDAMFKKADGSRWRDSHQHRPFTDAVKGARIEPPGSFHTLRHTYASLAIMAGAPLNVIAANLGHADTKMVERHYGHLAESYRAKIMMETAPSFGLEKSNVAPMGT